MAQSISLEQITPSNAAEWIDFVRGIGIQVNKMYDLALVEPVMAYVTLRFMGKALEDIQPSEAMYLGEGFLQKHAALNKSEIQQYQKLYQGIKRASSRSMAGYKGAVKRHVEPAYRRQFPENTNNETLTDTLATAGAMCHLMLAEIASERSLPDKEQVINSDAYRFVKNRLIPEPEKPQPPTPYQDGNELTSTSLKALIEDIRTHESGRPLTNAEWESVKHYLTSIGQTNIRTKTDFYRWYLELYEPALATKEIVTPVKVTLRERVRNFWQNLKSRLSWLTRRPQIEPVAGD